MYTRLRAALLALPLVLAAGSAQAEAGIADVSAWFNSWSTLSSPFVQVNDDGTTSKGMLYMKRPGKMRIDYEDQDAKLIVGAGSIAIYDGTRRSRPPEVYPLKRTPLWQILRPAVDLTKSSSVRRVTRAKGGLISVRVYDPKHPEAGELDLHFADRKGNAFLTGWTSYPQSGEVVKVRLTAPRIGVSLKNSLFSRH
ncbi:LolA family protein [Leisingera caerulea]|uniref:LolA family protein n=1 Tax=Leisingera caerulea TaxID=506591 RepID=UPI001377D0A9|nr:outer membrane lipoprotein carrier protein LolA [Leisingera caerulea]